VSTDGRVLFVTGLSPEDAGDIALHVRVPLYELTSETPSLEQLFLTLAGAA
jgi:ABC-2 type transport system ATP-binding protein